ncbi:tRNA guanosine(15) transglycosylase TgtA [Candidatus Thorarchaeota archaeon]|nr:MAG: tRNA guanosine(15) transglycosylase TgtA [Candidatus Thorarchaeota archaeon]
MMKMGSFETRTKDGMARIGEFSSDHGTVTTPLLMPVVHPAKTAVTPQQLKDDFGFQMVITNSYIIRSHESFREKAVSDGVHGLIGFDGPVMTDSGTFQMYFHGLPEIEIDPLEIVDFQKKIQSDIGTILDVFSAPNVGREQVHSDVETSLQRAKISAPEKGNMMLAGTIQGGIYPDLREYSAKEMAKLDFDIHPVGGVVPLMESYRYAEIMDILYAVKRHLPPNRPVHLFGCGHPMFFAQAAMMGCDFFDSASYAKFAEAGRMMLPKGTVHLESLRELPCSCPVCSEYSAKELKSMPKQETSLQLMKHNLYISGAEIRRVRQAISDGTLMELVARRARGHPTLYDALMRMLNGYEEFYRWDNRSTSGAILYSGNETTKYPAIESFSRQMISTYRGLSTEQLVIFPHHGDRPFADAACDVADVVASTPPEENLLVFLTPIGAVPWELEHVHPVQQCIFPRHLDRDTLHTATSRLEEFLASITAKRIRWLTRKTPVNSILTTTKKDYEMDIIENQEELIQLLGTGGSFNWSRRKLQFLFKYQWQIDAAEFLEQNEVEIELSRSTGKIRHIRRNGEILFTLVPTTGLLTPTYEGGVELAKMGLKEKYMVVMTQEASEFVAEGKSALAKFVKQVDPKLHAAEEVLVLDEEETLIATGRTLLSGFEMIAFNRGVAVTIRHSISQ